MQNETTKKTIILFLLATSIFLGIKYYLKYQKLSGEILKIDNMILLSKNKKIKNGIYIVYPPDGSLCSTCLFNFSKRIKKYYGRKPYVLFPEYLKVKLKNESVFVPIHYQYIYPSLLGKIVFIDRKLEIVFLSKLDYLMTGKKQNLKYMIYNFKIEEFENKK